MMIRWQAVSFNQIQQTILFRKIKTIYKVRRYIKFSTFQMILEQMFQHIFYFSRSFLGISDGAPYILSPLVCAWCSKKRFIIHLNPVGAVAVPWNSSFPVKWALAVNRGLFRLCLECTVITYEALSTNHYYGSRLNLTSVVLWFKLLGLWSQVAGTWLLAFALRK